MTNKKRSESGLFRVTLMDHNSNTEALGSFCFETLVLDFHPKYALEIFSAI